MDEFKVAFISGASAGIGKATAELLYEKNYRVYGTSRKAAYDDNLEKINSNGTFIKLIPMDLMDEISIKKAIEYVLEKEGKIDVLINNAGFVMAGALEDVNNEEILKQFETNLFGHIKVIKEVLPAMRDKKEGKIINISSLGAEFVMPYQSLYSGTKRALEAITESLYIELKPFNIGVCIIDPGNTKTNAPESRQLAKAVNNESVYFLQTEKAVAAMAKEERNGMPAEAVARCIYNAIKKKNMPIRKVSGLQYKILFQLKRLLPLKAVLFILRKMY